MSDGVPGGYGAVGRRGGGGRVVEPIVAPTYGTSGGYYTDAQGRQITQAQAQAAGRVDMPGEAAEKLRSIGGGATTTQIEQRFGIEEALKRGDITRPEAIELTRRNIEGRPLEITRTVEQRKEVRDTQAAEAYFRGLAAKRTGTAQQEAQRRQAVPERVFVTISGKRVPFVSRDEYKGLTTAQTLQKAGGLRTTAAILSSTELFAKAAETEARGIGKVLGFDSKYDQALAELATATAARLKSRPGALEVLLESPVTAAIPVGAGLKVGTFAARAALVGTAGKISKISPQAANILKTGSLAVEPVVGAGVLGYVGKDLLSSKDYYEAVGKIATYGVMTPGAAFGYKQATKGITAFQTRGLETVPAPISPEVLSGKVTFPTTRAGKFKTFREEFRDIEGKFSGFHSTSEAFPKSGVTVAGKPIRPLDVPGLYVSPYKAGASPVFLRVPGETRAQQIISNIFSSSALKPEVNLIRGISDIRRIKEGKNVQKAREFLDKLGEEATPRSLERIPRSREKAGAKLRMGRKVPEVDALTKAYIEPKLEMGGFRGEAQAILAPGTKIGRVTTSKRFLYKGQYIPLVERSIVPFEGKPAIKGAQFEAKTTNNILRTRQYYESGGVRPMSPIGYSTTRKPSRPAVSSSLIPSSILKQYSRADSSISRTASSMSIISSILKVPPSRTIPSRERQPPSRPQTSTTRQPSSRPPTSTTRKPPSRPPTSTKRQPPSRPPTKPQRRKILPKPPRDFSKKVEDVAKASKKRGKFVWNIKNKIPTLESLIG